jgi:hypothetical protein
MIQALINSKKKINKNLFKNATVLIYRSELWGNKGDGIKLKYMRSHLLNCKIR